MSATAGSLCLSVCCSQRRPCTLCCMRKYPAKRSSLYVWVIIQSQPHVLMLEITRASSRCPQRLRAGKWVWWVSGCSFCRYLRFECSFVGADSHLLLSNVSQEMETKQTSETNKQKPLFRWAAPFRKQYTFSLFMQSCFDVDKCNHENIWFWA